MSMMPLSLFLLVVLALFTVLHVYLGRKLSRLLALVWPAASQKRFIIPLMALLALLYPAGRLTESLLPDHAGTLLYGLGSYWLGLASYAFWLLLVGDLLAFVCRRFWRLPFSWPVVPAALAVLLCSLFTVAYGAWNAKHPVVKSYSISIAKETSRPSLHLVLVSDIHIGRIIDAPRLQDMVNRINTLQPELVILAGDITDDFVPPLLEQRMDLILQQLSPPLGTYAVLGNHEYISQQPELAIAWLKQGRVQVLRDQAVKVDEAFYLVGRDDYSRQRFTGTDRLPLTDLTAHLDQRLPIFVVDHQPVQYATALSQGVDLLLSGHTHHGQFSPNQVITKLIFENDWGYLKKGRLHTIVSCGYGTWGPPIRVGNQPEIVDIHITFTRP